LVIKPACVNAALVSGVARVCAVRGGLKNRAQKLCFPKKGLYLQLCRSWILPS